MTSHEFLNISTQVAIWIMTVSLLLPFYRLFKGPTLPDRVVALDQIAIIVVSIIICDAISSNEVMLMDVVLIISFVLVFGAIIISHYLHKKETGL